MLGSSFNFIEGNSNINPRINEEEKYKIVLGFIILPCPNWFIGLYFPNLGFIYLLLGPLGLMGPHVPVTRVWGTPIEANLN